VNMTENSQALREHLLYLLKGGGAHVKFDNAIADFPAPLYGKKPPKLPFSAWQVLEHMRIAQCDILDFSTNPNYRVMEWPAAYWPKSSRPPDESAWGKSVKQFGRDAREMQKLVADPATDLFAKIAWGSGQTILRAALLVADHNAYHLGQLVLIRRLLGVWKD
jgi:hypothetical protein